MLILAPTYSMKIFIGQTIITTYVIPFVIGMLLARDSIVGISIPSSILLPATLFTRSVMHHPTTNSLITLFASLIMMCTRSLMARVAAPIYFECFMIEIGFFCKIHGDKIDYEKC